MPAITFCTSTSTFFSPVQKVKPKPITTPASVGKVVILDHFLLVVFFANLFCFLLFRGCLAVSKVESTKVTALYCYHCVLIHAWQLLAAAGTFMIFSFTPGPSSYWEDFCLLFYLVYQSPANK